MRRDNAYLPIPGHSDPRDCIKTLNFKRDKAGRDILLSEQNIKFRDSFFRTRGDCAIIALALALNKPYCCMRDFIKARWERHNPKDQLSKLERGDPKIQSILRRVKEAISPEHDPFWGTPSIVYANILEQPDMFSNQKQFELVYGEERGKPPICICNTAKTYVLDGSWGERNKAQDHVTAVLEDTIYGDTDIRIGKFRPAHIWESNFIGRNMEQRDLSNQCTGIHHSTPALLRHDYWSTEPYNEAPPYLVDHDRSPK